MGQEKRGPKRIALPSKRTAPILLPREIHLTNLRAEREETLKIIDLDRQTAHRRIDVDWWNEDWLTSALRIQAPDRHWQWRKFVGEFQSKPYVYRLAAESSDGQIQGAIIFDVYQQSAFDSDLPTAYVKYLASAPRNRRGFGKAPRFEGVGKALVGLVAMQGFLRGAAGRVTLSSLPEAMGFYLKHCYFTVTGKQTEGLPVLELLPEHAKMLVGDLRKEGVF